MHVIDIDRFNMVIPSEEKNLKRLKFLKEEASKLRIAVFGKYNHGKSTLLNALIEKEIFKVADKRETTKNDEYEHNNVIWVDTPGLNADVHGKDDKEAMKGAFQVADILFLVHNVKAGELDKSEMQVFRELMKQDKNYQNKMFLILTQIDQIQAGQLEIVKEQIRKQLPELTIFCVSAQRYKKGIAEGIPKFVELSRMNEIINSVGKHITELAQTRNEETKRLITKVEVALEKKKKNTIQLLQTFQYESKNKKNKFKDDLVLFLNKIKNN